MAEPARHSGFPHPGTQQVLWSINHVSSMCRGAVEHHHTPSGLTHSFPQSLGTRPPKALNQVSLSTALRAGRGLARDAAPPPGAAASSDCSFLGYKGLAPFQPKDCPSSEDADSAAIPGQFYTSLHPVLRPHALPAAPVHRPQEICCSQVSLFPGNLAQDRTSLGAEMQQ